MAIRFTNSGKWSDKWFRDLSPCSKTLYWYLWDVCDIAGFWEIDLEHAAYNTKIPNSDIEGAFKGLSRGFIQSDGYIWIRRFLYHQRNLPLNKDNKAHVGILRRIDEHKSLFPNVLELLEQQGPSKGLHSPTSISISKGKGISKEEKEIFNIARKRFPGSKNGLDVEFTNFQKKHKDWREVLPLLLPAIEQQIIWRKADERYWKMFQTWINQRCWTEEASTVEIHDDGLNHCQHPGCKKYWSKSDKREFCNDHKP